MQQPIQRRQFPLTAAPAITIHISQGTNLARTTIVAPNAKESDQALLYVALSRVREAHHTTLQHWFSPKIFQHGPADKGATALLKHLRGNNDADDAIQECLHKQNDTNSSKSRQGGTTEQQRENGTKGNKEGKKKGGKKGAMAGVIANKCSPILVLVCIKVPTFQST